MSAQQREDDDDTLKTTTEPDKECAELYVPAIMIPGYRTRATDYRVMDDRAFVSLMEDHNYLRKAMKKFLENARVHEYDKGKSDEEKLTEELIVNAFSRRADLCCEYKLLAQSSDATISTLEDVDLEIRRFQKILCPFVIKTDNLAAEFTKPDCVVIPFNNTVLDPMHDRITILYNKVEDARLGILAAIERRICVFADPERHNEMTKMYADNGSGGREVAVDKKKSIVTMVTPSTGNADSDDCKLPQVKSKSERN